MALWISTMAEVGGLAMLVEKYFYNSGNGVVILIIINIDTNH